MKTSEEIHPSTIFYNINHPSPIASFKLFAWAVRIGDSPPIQKRLRSTGLGFDGSLLGIHVFPESIGFSWDFIHPNAVSLFFQISHIHFFFMSFWKVHPSFLAIQMTEFPNGNKIPIFIHPFTLSIPIEMIINVCYTPFADTPKHHIKLISHFISQYIYIHI